MNMLHVLITAAVTGDFVNNTCFKIKPGPNGQTVFNRLFDCTNTKIENAFNMLTESMLKRIKVSLRNRKVILAFDTHCQAFYGNINNNPYWIHDYNPVRGSTGSYIFITVAIVVGEKRFTLGVLPVPRGWNQADYVEKLIVLARRYIVIESCSFDRGFTSYELINRLKSLRVKYQIFWKKGNKKETWVNKELKTLRNKEMKEVIHVGNFNKNHTKYDVRTRFVIIKQYCYKDDTQPYDWIFATNVKLKSQMWYIRRYKCRWGIETNYRMTKEVKIKTTTLNETKRYFLFAFSCLLYNLWKFTNFVSKTKISFKTFVFIFQKVVSKNITNQKPPDWSICVEKKIRAYF